jgi:hypothetical protein
MDQGRAYLVGKLRERGLSKRQTVRILNMIFREMGQALKLGGGVEFPFGNLKKVKPLSKRWLMMDDEPMKPFTVEHDLDEAGNRLQNGIKALETDPGRR